MRMINPVTADTSPSAQRFRGQQKIAIIAQSGLLMECLAEILCGRFPDYEITTYAGQDEIPQDIVKETRLALLYYADLAQAGEIVEHFKALEPGVSIGIIVGGPEAGHPILRQLVETQKIDGVLPLSMHLDVFVAGIELLAMGGEHFPALLLQKSQPVFSRGTRPGQQSRVEDTDGSIEGGRSPLTNREVEIMDLVCRGTQNKNIAGRLKLSENTVKAHIRNIYKKMHVRNRTEAASQYFGGRDGRSFSLAMMF